MLDQQHDVPRPKRRVVVIVVSRVHVTREVFKPEVEDRALPLPRGGVRGENVAEVVEVDDGARARRGRGEVEGAAGVASPTGLGAGTAVLASRWGLGAGTTRPMHRRRGPRHPRLRCHLCWRPLGRARDVSSERNIIFQSTSAASSLFAAPGSGRTRPIRELTRRPATHAPTPPRLAPEPHG